MLKWYYSITPSWDGWDYNENLTKCALRKCVTYNQERAFLVRALRV